MEIKIGGVYEHNGRKFKVRVITKNDGYTRYQGLSDNGAVVYYSWSNTDSFKTDYTRIKPNWNFLELGQEIEDDSLKAIVLEVGDSGKTFLKSTWNGYKQADDWFTIEEAQNLGWKLVGQEEEPEDSAEKEAIELLKKNGYKIIKE